MTNVDKFERDSDSDATELAVTGTTTERVSVGSKSALLVQGDTNVADIF